MGGVDVLRIELLVRDPWVLFSIESALRAARGSSHRAPARPEIHVSSSWDEFLDMARGPAAILIFNPDFAEPDARTSTRLSRLLEDGTAGRIILSRSDDRVGSSVLAQLGDEGISVSRYDDDHHRLLSLLVRAGTAALVGTAIEELRDVLPPATLELLTHVLLTGYTRWRVREAAASVHLGDRALGRRCHELRLPSPGTLLEWSRLFRLKVLHGLGVASPTRLAFLVGYGSSRSLYRLTLDFTDRPLQKFLTDPTSLLAECFREAMVA